MTEPELLELELEVGVWLACERPLVLVVLVVLVVPVVPVLPELVVESSLELLVELVVPVPDVVVVVEWWPW